mmetsp:Transcript_16794/g.38295  ORF Transcript_16794/g.38295 Transcript_16794/m.38295 type:complete len:85 (-) Transcript_16794:195-449(-)
MGHAIEHVAVLDMTADSRADTSMNDARNALGLLGVIESSFSATRLWTAVLSRARESKTLPTSTKTVLLKYCLATSLPEATPSKG